MRSKSVGSHTKVARIIEDPENAIVDPGLGAEEVALDIDDVFVHEDGNLSDSSEEEE